MILKHLHSEYKKTRWPFFWLTGIKTKFGAGCRKELNDLFKDGSICKREGMNGELVQLLVDEDGNNIDV